MSEKLMSPNECCDSLKSRVNQIQKNVDTLLLEIEYVKTLSKTDGRR